MDFNIIRGSNKRLIIITLFLVVLLVVTVVYVVLSLPELDFYSSGTGGCPTCSSRIFIFEGELIIE